MSVDPSVVAAMQAAVDAAPGNAALRAHLAGLRLRAGDHEAALAEARTVLQTVPDNTAALAVARDAQAESFGRMLAALQGREPFDLPPAGPAQPAPEPHQQRLRAGHEDRPR